MRRLVLLAACALVFTVGASASASAPSDPNPPGETIDNARDSDPIDQHGPTTGHLPAGSLNVELVGKLRVHDARPGVISNVGTLRNYAYLGRFSPGCAGGVYVVDISNPASPKEVGFLPAHAGSFVGEGVRPIHLDTEFFEGDVLAFNNEICGSGGLGGVSLWDVTNPLAPQPLAENFGDTKGGHVHQYHSVFPWQQGDRAFVVASDDEEGGSTDVDIIEITDPRHPKMLTETGFRDWPQAKVGLAYGETVFHHDVYVRKIDDMWQMLVSYWDAGYIKLNINDPAHPVFINKSHWTDPDPRTGFSPPDGHAHYAEWDREGRYIIGTDENFAPYRTAFKVTTGPNAGPYPAGEFGWSKPISTLPDKKLNGLTVFGGYGCNDDLASIPPPSVLGSLAQNEQAIVVFQRGPVQDPNHPHGACRFDEKVQNAVNAGYTGVIIANHHTATGGGDFPNAFTCGGGNSRPIPAICVGHRAMHLMFNRTPGYSVPYPLGNPGNVEPNPGDLGPKVEATTAFKGWGYIHLFDGETLREIDTYGIPEQFNPAFATGFGALTIHKVTFDPEEDLAYLSWYAGGFRVVAYGPTGMREVGHFIDQGGNNFWGQEMHETDDGEHLVLASDRDSGLYIFRYTGPRP